MRDTLNTLPEQTLQSMRYGTPFFTGFFSIGGGAEATFGDNDKAGSFGKRISPTLNFAIGKWFTPGPVSYTHLKQCMNFKFVILFALTLLVGSTVYGQDNVIDEVVWVVGDEAILKSEVDVYKRQEYGMVDEVLIKK